MRFTYTISHVPGKHLYTADTLSRAPLVRPLSRIEEKLESDVKAYVDSIVKYLPATENRLEELRCQQQQDEVTRQLMTYCSEGWPDRSRLPGPLNPYWPERSELAIQQGLLMKGNRLVIPVSMRLDVLDRIHEAHQGIVKCRERAKASVWWPGLSKQLEEVVNKCPTCIKERVNAAEPEIPSDLPDRPWQKVAADLFELKGQPYLLVTDYFSRYVEVSYDIARCSRPPQVHLCKTWHPGSALVRQRPTVLREFICQVCRRVWIYPHHNQPQIPKSKWPGGTCCANGEKLAQESSRSLQGSDGLPFYSP